MSTEGTALPDDGRKPERSLGNRVAAARVAVKASKITGHPVEPWLKELAETELPGDWTPPAPELSRWRRFVSALLPNRR